MSLQLHVPSGPSQQLLHQGIVVKYSGSTSVVPQKSPVLSDNLNVYTASALSKQATKVGTISSHKVMDISLCGDAVYVLFSTGQRLKLTITPSENQAATSLFTSTLLEDFIARPSLSFPGPEYLVCQTRTVVTYNALLKSSDLFTNNLIEQPDGAAGEDSQKHLTSYVTLIFSNPQFLPMSRLLLDGNFLITNCAFDESTVIVSFLSGHILFLDRTQQLQKDNIIDSNSYSYYGLISYTSLASRLMSDFQSAFPGNFSFREAIRLLSISPPKHVPFIAFHGCDFVLAMPLGCIFIFTRHNLHDGGSSRLILSHATVALPFVRHDLPNKSFKIMHYAASRVSFFLPVSDAILIVGYDNSVIQYYCWDVDGMAHPLDGVDLSAGKVTHIHAGLMLLPESKDSASTLSASGPTYSTQQSSITPVKVLIVATIGSSFFFIVQCFPKMVLIATVPAPDRFVDSGKISSPTDQLSPILIYTAIDGSLRYTHFPNGYLFRSGFHESSETTQHYEQPVKAIQKISALLRNVTCQYESDESASELNILNDRSKTAIPAFLLSSSEHEASSCSAEDHNKPKRSILDIGNIKVKPMGSYHRNKRPRKLTNMGARSSLWTQSAYNNMLALGEPAEPELLQSIESFSISPFDNKTAPSHVQPTFQPVCRPFEQISVQLGNEPLLMELQGLYSLLGMIHRRKLETGERVSYDDNSLTRLSIIRNTHNLIKKTAFMTQRVTISEYQKSISPSINIHKLLMSPENLARATELLVKNDQIFRSSRNRILPHIRNAYLHLKHADRVSRKTTKKPTSPFCLAKPFPNQLASPVKSDSLASAIPSSSRKSLALKSCESPYGVHGHLNTERVLKHRGSHAFRYLPVLARDLMLDNVYPVLMEPEHISRNAWSPSPKLWEKPHHLTSIIMRSRNRQTELLTRGHADNFIGVLRSKVLEKPIEGTLDRIRYKEKERTRPRVVVTKYEHIKIIDKELLKDLRRFKALKLGRDLGGRILRDKAVLSALLTGKNASENLRDIIDLTSQDGMFLDDILSMGKNIISILDPENDYTFGSIPESRMASSHKSLRPGKTLDHEDSTQMDAIEIARLITPNDTSLKTLRYNESPTAERKDLFGFDLMNQLLRNFDYRLNQRRVRSGINGILTVSDEYTKTVLLRRSASLPTIETLNRNRIDLATKLDSTLGHEMGISRWDEDANRSYRARILSIYHLSDPESSIWDTEEICNSSSSSVPSDLESGRLRISMSATSLVPFTARGCFSADASRRVELSLDKDPLPRRPYSARRATEVNPIGLQPLDLDSYANRMAVCGTIDLETNLDNYKAVTPLECVHSDNVDSPESENHLDSDVSRLNSGTRSASFTTSSSDTISAEPIECTSSIFGIKGDFNPNQYTVSSSYLPDLLLRAALHDLKKQATTISSTKGPLSLLRDDCSQIFKILRKSPIIFNTKDQKKQIQYGYNPLSRYCMQNHMFCPREHLELCTLATRDIALDVKRRAYSFDKLESLILAKGKYGQKSIQPQCAHNHLWNPNLTDNTCLSTHPDWSLRDDYDYLSFKPIKSKNWDRKRSTAHTSASLIIAQQPKMATSHAFIGNEDHSTAVRSKAFTTYTETLALNRIKKKQTTALPLITKMRTFKKLFTRELYEDWARLYRHNVIRKDTLYDDQFEVTVMKPTFPLYYHVMTNRTGMDGMTDNIINDELDGSESVVHANLVVTKAQFPFSVFQNQSVDSLFDDMQLALGSWPEQQSEESIIPHHYAVPPKPPYYNPRIPVVDSLDGFYDPASIVPLEPLLPEGEDGIQLQIGVFTPYAFCLKNPEFVDNEKLTTILNPVAYTNCNDIILSSSHCEKPRSFLAKHLKDAGYPLLDDADSEPLDLEQLNSQVSYLASFDARVNEFIASFFSLPEARPQDIAKYHKGIYAHSVHSLPSHTEGFFPKVRLSMLTVGQAIKTVFIRYFQSFTPVQRKIMAQTVSRGTTIDYNRLNYVPYSFLQLLLLYSAALAILELLKGQRYASKQPEQSAPLPISRRLRYILDTQFPVEPIPPSKIKNKKDSYGRASFDISTALYFNFYSVQAVLTYSCEAFVRYLLIIIYYVRLCNLETCISKFVDYQLRRVLKQDVYIQELSDPYKGVVKIYEQMETHICTVRSLQKVKEFSCVYEDCLQRSIFKATSGEISTAQPFPFLTYFGPRSDPVTLSRVLERNLNTSAELLPMHSTTLAVVYNDSDLKTEELEAILSNYALGCMLDDTKMHIHGVYVAILNHFRLAKRTLASESTRYFPGFLTNLTAIPLSILILLRRLEEVESLHMSHIQKAIIRRKLHIVLLEAYVRIFTVHRKPSSATFSPLVPMYVHIFRIPRSSNYQNYASMLRQRQQIIYKILYDASMHELCLRMHNNYIIQQPDITGIIGIFKADVLFNFFSAHFHPAYVATYVKHIACHKVVIGEGIYSEADIGSKDESSHLDDSAISSPNKIYSELRNNQLEGSLNLSWYTSLCNAVIKNPLTECIQRAYRNRYSYDLYEDNVSLLEQVDQSSYKGDSQFLALVATNRFDEVRRNIEERRLSLDRGCLSEEPTGWCIDQSREDLPALGRSIFRNRILDTLKSSIVAPTQKTLEDRSLIERSSVEELCISESLGDSVQAGERILANTTVQLLKTQRLARNISKWTELAEDEESNLEQSCMANPPHVATQNQSRASADSTYELRKAFTDIRVPRYRTSSVLMHTNTKRLGILLSKPLPSIPTGATHRSSFVEQGELFTRSRRSASNA
ncbi:Hypothetical protein GLP15_2213 [Giardia lamblia P15]|uniref:Uncharacterized protein n=1 Tax=Giardia intestinalis (strain P15) TaxID=658858 RepID=E1F6T8_GIAIA|nr:Hypothetical protein GLP15_2213 [Giardia lamblia P15]